MIATTLPAPAMPQAQTPGADPVPADAAASAAGSARTTGHAVPTKGDEAAARTTAHDPHDPSTAHGAEHFARLLAPDAASAEAAHAGAPARPVAQEQAAADDARPGQLPDQLLGLLALLGPSNPAAPAAGAAHAAVVPAGGADTQAGPAPNAAAPTANTPAAHAGAPSVQAALAAVSGPQATSTAPAAPAAGAPVARSADPQAALPATGAQAPSPQVRVDAGAPQDLAARTHAPRAHAAAATEPASSLPTGAAHAAETPGDAFTRLLGDAVAGAGRDAPQGDPAVGQPLPATQPSATTAARPPLLPHAPLPQPADPGAGYGDDFGNGVLWMAEKALGHAQLRVTPEHLGPIDVRLQLDGARVHAEFSSAQPEVRHALESSLPRLRELLGQHGLELAQADVGQRQPDARPRPTIAREADDRDPLRDGIAPSLPPLRRVLRGLLDEYA